DSSRGLPRLARLHARLDIVTKCLEKLAFDILDHEFAPGMTPVTDVPRLPTRPPAKSLHGAAGVKEGPDTVGTGYLRNRNGRFTKSGKESATGCDEGRQLPEAQVNVPLAEVGKERLREAD